MTRRPFIVFFLAISSLLFFEACAPKRTTRSPIAEMRGAALPNPNKIKSPAWRLFFQAEQAFAFKKYDEALSLYKEAKSKSNKGRAHMVSSYRIGTIYYYREDYSKASEEFGYYLKNFPKSDLSFDVTYNYAASEFQLEHYENTSRILESLTPGQIQSQGPDRAEMIYRLAALSASAQGNHVAAIEYYAAQIQLPLSEGKRQQLRERVDFHLVKLSTRPPLDELLKKISEPITRSKITEQIDRLAAAAAQPIGGGSAAPEAFEIGRSDIDPKKRNIGIILPLSGKWAAYGQRALRSILLAAQVYESSRDWDFHLFIRDSQSSPLTAQNAVDDLVLKNKVFAIIGSTSWKESLAVAKRSQQLGVVNLSLTVKEGLSARGPQLFQNGLTAKVQMENLVRYCFEERNLKRFGILAPNDSFGKEMAESFWDAVESYGGRIVAFHLYTPNQTDFQTNVRSLVGLDDPDDLRRNEWKEVRKYIEEQKAQGVRNPRAELPPVVTFDALFIPDTPKALGQIAPSLAYFDVTGVPLLGTAEWNTDQLYRRAGRYVEGAIFPGTINAATKNTKQNEFVTRYRAAFGRTPDLLAAQSFEAMELMATAISRTNGSNYSELSHELSRIQGYKSPLGLVSFDDVRVAQRQLPIYTIEYGGRVKEH